MARIPDDVVERIKREVSLLRLVEAKGIALKKQGKDYFGHCPFHDDKTPSLSISPDTNLWHCLGACNVGGSVIDWVMKCEGVSFRHAVELLQEDAALITASPAVGVKRTTARRLPSPFAADADDQAALTQVIDYYHQTLKQSPEALAYLERRGLTHPELIDQFKLGYANRTLGLRLPDKNRQAGAVLRATLQRLGLLRDTGHEHFNGSLVIPVVDGQGHVLEVYGRKIVEKQSTGLKHLYLPGPHRGVWNEAALAGTPEVILCESLIDAMTFWCAGYRNVTASYGVNGFTDDHLATFRRQSIQRVLIAYDRDAAGDQAAEALAQRLMAEGFDCFRLQFPKGMDANDYALKLGPPAKSPGSSPGQALGLAIRQAHWLGKGKAPERQLDLEELVLQTELQEALETTVGMAEEDDDAEADTADGLPSLAAEPPLPAARLPEPPAPEVSAQVSKHEAVISLGNRVYRVRGWEKNTGLTALKVNLRASLGEAPGSGPGQAFHTDQLDLCHAKQRNAFIQQASSELGVKDTVIKADLGKVLLKVEALLEAQLQGNDATPTLMAKTLDGADRQAALALLQDPRLIERLTDDFARCGIVGETTNALVGYLAGVSRLLERPLAVMIQSSSAAGKSSLMEAILTLMPEDERVQYSAMTGQSLFYLGETDLKHKILAISEEEGAHHAAYALKLLQSEGQITIASTTKDVNSGQLMTQTYRVEGPVMLFMTTTAIDLDEELLNRCLVLSVDESREQTEAIHRLQRQRETLDGLLVEQDKQAILQVHRNAQRLLKPRRVVNPYAERLTFLSDKTRTRRDHMKYLALIRAIALLHQYQRPIKTVMHRGQKLEYIEATLDDIALANRLAHEVLGRTLDELPPQTRKLLCLIHAWVTAQCQAQAIAQADFRFSRKQVREATSWGNTQLRLHLDRLLELEYLIAHRGGRGQTFLYELVYRGEGEHGHAFLMGLAALDDATMADLAGQGAPLAGSKRGQNGPITVPSRGLEAGGKPHDSSLLAAFPADAGETAEIGRINGESYRSGNGTALMGRG